MENWWNNWQAKKKKILRLGEKPNMSAIWTRL
jgi:hypothetical protein